MSCRELLQFKTTSLFWLSKFAVTFWGDILGAKKEKKWQYRKMLLMLYTHAR